jgi:hypothetical protein
MQVCTKMSEITVNVCVVSWCIILSFALFEIFTALGKPRQLMMSFNFPGKNKKKNKEILDSG